MNLCMVGPKMLAGKSPYEVVPITDMLRHLEEGHRLPFPSGCSDAW